MDASAIIEQLENQLSRINSALAALQGTTRKPGRPAKQANGRKRHMSAAARKKIGDAMRKRWAARKRAA
ncbi:MAG TPA: hypothetical protein VFB79_20030 [Candidatus Angelobacter sp.]|nr:hypothetical protein [Candidatus Angelobacter sp.]